MHHHAQVSTLFLAPLALAAVINPLNTITPAARPSISGPPAFGINLYQGSISGPCSDLKVEMAFDDSYVLNSTLNHCFSTKGQSTTCIGRRTLEDQVDATNVETQRYEAVNGGLDGTVYNCTVIGYQDDGCPEGTGALAQYHQGNETWSWDHETRVRDDVPGELWSVQSFRMSCKL